jgi:predicted methyltransferase
MAEMNTKPPAVALALAVLALAAPAGVGATPAFPAAVRAGPPPADDKDALATAVSGASRAPRNKARDVFRHPNESLTFWGLRPGDAILELDPGGGYWAEILAPFAQATSGRYVGLRSSELGGAGAPQPGSIDFVLTGREIHNYIRRGELDKVMASSFAALKPGGVLAVEEHRADPRPMAPDAADGYVTEKAVVDAAARAGFRLDGRSEVNANPKDSKDHPFGVWTLPPDRRSSPIGKPADPAFDHAKYDAIGESDRMTLRFRKPA